MCTLDHKKLVTICSISYPKGWNSTYSSFYEKNSDKVVFVRLYTHLLSRCIFRVWKPDKHFIQLARNLLSHFFWFFKFLTSKVEYDPYYINIPDFLSPKISHWWAEQKPCMVSTSHSDSKLSDSWSWYRKFCEAKRMSGKYTMTCNCQLCAFWPSFLQYEKQNESLHQTEKYELGVIFVLFGWREHKQILAYDYNHQLYCFLS